MSEKLTAEEELRQMKDAFDEQQAELEEQKAAFADQKKELTAARGQLTIKTNKLTEAQRLQKIGATEAHVSHTSTTPIGEIGAAGGVIERVSEIQCQADIFGEDVLEITVQISGNDGDIPVITPSVNAVNQPIIRGVKQPVKRKYVEALARSRTTKYTQELANSLDPSSLVMRESTVLTYPFTVHKDPAGPEGKAWLEGILMQQ